MTFYGAIPPMITPFRADGAVDYDAHQFNVDKWNHAGLGGYLALGSNSEAVSLSWEEKLKLIELTVGAAAPGMPVLAGTGLESTYETIRLTNAAARLGASAALIITPFFYRGALGDKEMIGHYQAVADASDIPVLIYNVPKYTGVNLPAEVIANLSAHPNIIGMKDSTGVIKQLETFLEVAAPDFQVMVGTAGAWLEAQKRGIKAGIMALANCAPEACVSIQRAFQQRDLEKATELQEFWSKVNKAVTAMFGVAGLKYACELLGYKGGELRLPLTPANEDARRYIDHLLAEIPA